MQKFNDLKNIYKKNGESSNSVKIPSDLSRWTSKQRGLRKKYKLSHKRIDLLNSIDFDWKS